MQATGGERAARFRFAAQEQAEAAAGFGRQLQAARNVGIQAAQGEEGGGDGGAAQDKLGGPEGVRLVYGAQYKQTVEGNAQLGRPERVEVVVEVEVHDPAVRAGGAGGGMQRERAGGGSVRGGDELVDGAGEQATPEGLVQWRQTGETTTRRGAPASVALFDLPGQLGEAWVSGQPGEDAVVLGWSGGAGIRRFADIDRPAGLEMRADLEGLAGLNGLMGLNGLAGLGRVPGSQEFQVLARGV